VAATFALPSIIPVHHFILPISIESIKKRLTLTFGSDLRGRMSADASFQLALAGVQQSSHIFDALVDIGIHELHRAGDRSSFEPIYILQMIEKFAACGFESSAVLQMYHTAGLCLQKKGYSDTSLIDSLKNGEFGLQSDRPLLWLWRFSARQKKVVLSDYVSSASSISWDDIYHDTSKGLVVDIGCGCGVSLLNLSRITDKESADDISADIPAMKWSDYNFAGADLNLAMVEYANGVVSRQDLDETGRTHFFHLSALETLSNLQSYPGKIEMIMIQFPSPYRLSVEGTSGNSQLPSASTDGFMISKDVVEMVSKLLNDRGLLLFQTKCEDVAIHTKNLFLGTDKLECLPCIAPVQDIDHVYNQKQRRRPKRVEDWIKMCPETERAEGDIWSSRPLMPMMGRTETEVNCDHENVVVHRCLFSTKLR